MFDSAPGAALAVTPDRGGLRVVEQERIVSEPPAPLPALPRLEAEAPLTPHVDGKTAASEPRLTRHSSRRGDPFQEVEAADLPAAEVRPRAEPRDERAAELHAPLTERVLSRREPRSANPLEESQPATLLPAQRTPRSELEQPRSSRAELPELLTVRADREEPRVERRPQDSERAPAAAVQSPQAVPLAPQPELRPMERLPALGEPAVRSAPSVQVTIGRLIVEAVAPPAAAAPHPAPRPHAPRLSLDDYLRQRRSQA